MRKNLPSIKYRRISELAEWPQNYRNGDVDAIRKSITRFGFNGALRVRDSIVIAGNHSLKALMALQDGGVEMPHGITGEVGNWSVPTISLDHLSDSEATAFAIADNRTHDVGSDDEERLRQLLDSLRIDGEFELIEASGFSDDDVKKLLGDLPKNFEPTDGSDQGNLGVPRLVTCPNCAKEFALER